jgi:GT2 family glycosyltransferase/glycosyltransferase involved in cell wall biosynthesis/SAM-dependent methyltransferase
MMSTSLVGRRRHVLRHLQDFLFPAGTQRHRVLHAVRSRWRGGRVYYARELFGAVRFRVRARTLQSVIAPRDAGKILNILKEEGPQALLRRAYGRIARVWRPHRRKHRPVYAIATSWGPLTFRESTAPTVSIIIPVYNNHLYTYTCLQSILRSQSQRSYEIIVVDDCSTDATQAMLQVVKGVRIVRHDQNQGFIRACNAGAEVARGLYVLFLNNDTIVEPNWLDALASTFDAVPNVGLVGAKLIYPDGKLQEAGGIIWNDGSGWNYGRYDDPDKPEYSYLREVDYCSGACIVLPRELFREVGGFDELFAPAYGEDSDLAFKVRQAGKKVVYQPESEIIHFEGASSGTDTSSGVKGYQLVNREKLFQKWAHVLVEHAAPGERLHWERERNIAKRVLVVDACTPMPDQDAGSLKIYNFMKVFQSLSYHVTFAPDNLTFLEGYTNDLQRRGIQCLYWPYVSSLEDHLRRYGTCYDIILSCRPDVTEKYLESYRKWCPSAKVLYDTADLHYVRERRQAEIENNASLFDRAERRKAQELRLVAKTDCTIVVSELDRSVLLAEVPTAEVAVISAVHETFPRAKGFPETRDLFFLGGYQHVPNVDAVQYFVKDVFPLLRGKLPGVRFFIVGSRPPQSVIDLTCEDVIVTGHVPDLYEYMSGCRLSVNPLRYGAGIKGKIVTCMAYGVPCVGTTLAFEGMGLQNERDVLIGDTPQELADAIVRLYLNEPLWTKLSHNGYATVRSQYSFETARTRFDRVCHNVGRPTRPRHIPATYYGTCNVCGQSTHFKTLGSDNLRESLLCDVCGASCRNRSLAWGLLSLVGNGTVRSIAELSSMKSGPRILDTDCFGPMFALLSKAEFYTSSMYAPDRPFGKLIKPKILNMDLQAMTSPDDSYDVVLTSDVMEHVRRDHAAHREIHRCLKAGGYYVFTVPYVPGWASTQIRVDGSGDEDVCLMEKQYHGDPLSGDGILVYRIYGQDLLRDLKQIGFTVEFMDRPEPQLGILTKDLFVCRKL